MPSANKNLSWRLTRLWQKAMIRTLNGPCRREGIAPLSIVSQKPRHRCAGMVMAWLFR